MQHALNIQVISVPGFLRIVGWRDRWYIQIAWVRAEQITEGNLQQQRPAFTRETRTITDYVLVTERPQQRVKVISF